MTITRANNNNINVLKANITFRNNRGYHGVIRNLLCILFSVILTPLLHAQQLNHSLKNELDSIKRLDQKYRSALVANMNGKADSLAIVFMVKKEDLEEFLWKKQNEVDSLNTVKIEEIIKKYGYPGNSLVGEPTNEVAFYVIQHSKVIGKYLSVVKKAAEKGELRFQLYAMMLDRSLMFQDKEQMYGTQASGMSVKNPATNQWEHLSFIWPINDHSNVNERRKVAGFNQTVEESAKSMGIEFKAFALEEILKWRAEAGK